MSKPFRVFIVDDDIDFAESLALVLEENNCEVKLASSGEEAINTLKKLEFDITFMDVKLPGKNGVESFLEIRKLKPESKVVMMTGYSVSQLLDEAVENGAWGVLHKPFNMEYMFEMLGKIKSHGILIADDDPDFVNTIIDILNTKDYTVYVAGNGKEAVERIKSGGVDVLLLDLRMPLLSGLDVYVELKKSGNTVPTIIVTAYAEEDAEVLDKIRMLSVTGILTKPFDPKVLLQALKNITAS